MALTIQIPERTHEDFGHSLSKLLRLLSQLYTTEESHIILDFNQARMLNPFFLGGLACTIRHYETKGKIFELNYQQNFNINSYLDTICFPGSHTTEAGGEKIFMETLEKFRKKNYIPLIAFPTGIDTGVTAIRERVLSAVSSILRNQLNFTEKNLMPIVYMVDEMTHNINDHSLADKGFVFAQYYPANNYIDICICDYGIGILKSYQKSSKFYPENEQEAIEFAINGCSTKDRPESKGFGISTSRDMLVNGLKGKFFLLSGNTAYIQTTENKGIIDFPDNFFYQGSYLALRVPTLIDPAFNIYNYVE